VAPKTKESADANSAHQTQHLPHLQPQTTFSLFSLHVFAVFV